MSLNFHEMGGGESLQYEQEEQVGLSGLKVYSLILASTFYIINKWISIPRKNF